MVLKIIILLCVSLVASQDYYWNHTSLLNKEKQHLRKLYEDISILASRKTLDEEWKTFKTLHNKKYKTELEELRRKKIFAQNKLFIAKHNDLYENKVVTYSVEMNQFGDMTTEEFNKVFNMNMFINATEDQQAPTFTPPAGATIPKEKDWREKGAVTSVKNQGHDCGSCWAFSAVAALESHHFLKTGHLVDISEQNLIDCSLKFGNKGCKGGWPRKAFTYVQKNEGIDTETSYPYEEHQGSCRYKPEYSVTKDKGFVMLPKNEKALLEAVATIGPISVLIDASRPGFKFYKQGIYYDTECSTTVLRHAVLVVGYGAAECGCQYWLVKNSWGVKWGDEGYIKMARNRNNHCGIVTEAVYPLV